MKSNVMKKLMQRLKTKFPKRSPLRGSAKHWAALWGIAHVALIETQHERDQLKAQVEQLAKNCVGHAEEITSWENSDEAFRHELKQCSYKLEYTREKLHDEELMHHRALQMILHLREERDRAVAMLAATPDQLRAMVCQLRVFATSDNKQRSGYCVGTFLPHEILAKLQEHPEAANDFRDMVWAQTLEYALRGIFHINSRGNVSAVLFTKLGSRGGACGAVFDVGQGDFKVVTASRTIDPTVRAIEDQVLAEQQGRPVPKLDWEKFVKEDAAIQTLLEEGAKQQRQISEPGE